jgi:hypothetical protein
MISMLRWGFSGSGSVEDSQERRVCKFQYREGRAVFKTGMSGWAVAEEKEFSPAERRLKGKKRLLT